jgi:shikimate dehydrogenase
LTGNARLAGVIGWPVAHSRSPLLHNHWLARLGIDGAYVPLPVAPSRLEAAVRGLQAAGFAGVNVTVPHKEAVIALCDTLEASAQESGSVNTLVFMPDGRIAGSSSDGHGFLASLRAAGVDPAAGPALLLGAGGAARSIAAALLGCGVAVEIANRTPERAHALAHGRPGMSVVLWPDWPDQLAGKRLLVNTTSLGMTGQDPLPADLSDAPADLVVADIVYAPRETPLLAQARRRGLRTVEGIGMLLHQAVPGFAAWFGIEPVVDAEALALLTGTSAG